MVLLQGIFFYIRAARHTQNEPKYSENSLVMRLHIKLKYIMDICAWKKNETYPTFGYSD